MRQRALLAGSAAAPPGDPLPLMAYSPMGPQRQAPNTVESARKVPRPRKLPPELLAMDVPDLGRWGGCGCDLLVPACRRDGKPGCDDWRLCRHCGRRPHGKKPSCHWGYEPLKQCTCELGPCDHVRALKDHGVPLPEWGADLCAALPIAGNKGMDGYHESEDPAEATQEEPGSTEKEKVIRKRLLAGKSVARCGDRYREVDWSEVAGIYSRAGAARPAVLDRPMKYKTAARAAEEVRQMILTEARQLGQRVAEQLAARAAARGEGGLKSAT